MDWVIRYGDGCCLDTTNNSVCDVDENFEINESHENKDIQQSSKKESKLIKFVDNFLNKFKGLSQSLENEISEKRNYLVISLTILTIVVLTFILLNRTRNLKNKEIKGLRDVRGLRVYSENGIYIGKIDEIYVEQ